METDVRDVQRTDRKAENDLEASSQASFQIHRGHNNKHYKKNWVRTRYQWGNIGLYSEQEQQGDYYVDKAKKIGYLTKIIKLVELMSGSTVDANPQKIIAGLEPEVLARIFSSPMLCCSRYIAVQPVASLLTRMLSESWAVRKRTQNQLSTSQNNNPSMRSSNKLNQTQNKKVSMSQSMNPSTNRSKNQNTS